MSVEHLIPTAIRCQKLTGSFNGNPDACACKDVRDCAFSRQVRDKLETHPAVVERLKHNLKLYQGIKGVPKSIDSPEFIDWQMRVRNLDAACENYDRQYGKMSHEPFNFEKQDWD